MSCLTSLYAINCYARKFICLNFRSFLKLFVLAMAWQLERQWHQLFVYCYWHSFQLHTQSVRYILISILVGSMYRVCFKLLLIEYEKFSNCSLFNMRSFSTLWTVGHHFFIQLVDLIT